MKHLFASLLLGFCSVSSAQDYYPSGYYRIPETDWFEQIRDQQRCPPQRVIVIERCVRPLPVYGWVIVGWDYQPSTGGFTPRKMWLQIR